MKIPAKVFISYSHKDEKYKDKLITHLSSLKALGLIDEWHDRMLLPGSELHKTIDGNLNDSDIILLLISADYIASYSCYKDEFPKAFKKWQNGTALIVPVIVRETAMWANLPIGKFTALPQDGKPIYDWKSKDKAYCNIIKGLELLINSQRVKMTFKYIQCPKCGSTNLEITTYKPIDKIFNHSFDMPMKIYFKIQTKILKTGFFGKTMKQFAQTMDSNTIIFKCQDCNNIIEVKENKK